MSTKTTRFVAEKYLTSPEAIEAFLQDAFETGSVKEIVDALGVVARARGGMTALAEQTKLPRGSLYKALGEGANPTLETVTAIAGALGLRLSVSLAPT